MIYTGWLWLDPAMSLIIAIVILWSTWGLFRDSFNLAMDRVPEGISMAEISNHIKSQDGVEEIHDLHVWAVSTTETVMTAHLVMPQRCRRLLPQPPLTRDERAVRNRPQHHPD